MEEVKEFAIETPEERVEWYQNSYAVGTTLEEITNIIQANFDNAACSLISVGYHLKLVRDRELFSKGGYENIWNYAQDKFRLSKSSASRYMSINDRFSVGGNTPLLDKQYTGYGKSQLQEMLYLTDDQLEDVTSEMSVQDIRDVRKPQELQAPQEPDDEQGEEECCDIATEPESVHTQVIDGMGLKIVLSKPDMIQREYLNSFARRFIRCRRDWMLQDFENRVLCVDKSPEEIKADVRKGSGSRSWYFNTGSGVAHINLFDDYVQLWDEKCVCLGNFDWFYLAASIQYMWNVVAMERAQKDIREQEKDDVPEGPESDSDEDVIDAEFREIPEEPEYTPEFFLDEQSRRLDELLKLEEVYPEDYTDKDVERQKTIVAALAAMVSDLEEARMIAELEAQKPKQPELPILKNNDQRKEWLRSYKDWGLWYEDSNIGVKYYKYDFSNGARLIAEVYPNYDHRGVRTGYEYAYLHLVGGPKPEKHPSYGCGKWRRHEAYCKQEDCDTELIEFLKALQKGAK